MEELGLHTWQTGVSPHLWEHPSCLPSGVSKNRVLLEGEAICCIASQCTLEQNKPKQKATENTFSDLASRLCSWEIKLSESQVLSTRSLLNEFTMFSEGRLRRQGNICPWSHLHSPCQMFWVWSRDRDQSSFHTQLWLTQLPQKELAKHIIYFCRDSHVVSIQRKLAYFSNLKW